MKVGDRVRIIGDEGGNKTVIGKTGEIVGVFTHNKPYDYVVQFENITGVVYGLHDGNSMDEDFNFDPTKHDKRWFAKEHLELVTDPLWTGTVGFDKPADGLTARVWCADDIVCAKTSYNLKDMLSKTEENYMELLNIYEKRTEVAIDKKYDKKIKKVLAEDANMKIWQECFDKLAPLFENKDYCVSHLRECDVRRPEPLDDTKVKIKELEQQCGDEMMKLRTTIREIEAQLCLCENRDDKLEVLRIYNVINDEGKINA